MKLSSLYKSITSEQTMLVGTKLSMQMLHSKNYSTSNLSVMLQQSLFDCTGNTSLYNLVAFTLCNAIMSSNHINCSSVILLSYFNLNPALFCEVGMTFSIYSIAIFVVSNVTSSIFPPRISGGHCRPHNQSHIACLFLVILNNDKSIVFGLSVFNSFSTYSSSGLPTLYVPHAPNLRMTS